MRRATAFVVVLGVLVAGCGTLVVKPSGAEQSIADVVHRETGVTPSDVSCPSGVKAKVGVSFDCHFKGPGRSKYVAHVQITSVQGDTVRFYVRTALS